MGRWVGGWVGGWVPGLLGIVVDLELFIEVIGPLAVIGEAACRVGGWVGGWVG